MDPVTRELLLRLAMQFRDVNPAVYSNIVNVLAGNEAWKAATLLAIKPALAAAGKDLGAITATTGQQVSEPGQQQRVGQSKAAQNGLGLPGRPSQTGGNLIEDPTDTVGSALADRANAESSPTNPVPPNSPGTENGRPAAPVATGVQPGNAEVARSGPGSPWDTVRGAAQTITNATNPSSASPGGFSAAQGTVLAGDQNQLQRFALQAAGLNPDRMGHFGQIVAGMLAPLIAARRNAFGIQGGQNMGGLPQDIASFAKDFTTKGVDAFGNAQTYAQGVLNSPELRQYTSALSNPDQAQAMYQSLMPLLFAGANPLIQQAAADSAQRVQGQYSDQVFQNNGIDPNGGIFPKWLDANSQGFDPLTRRIFGLR